MTAPLLEIKGLTGGYPPVQIFRNINLSIFTGESVGLFGPNGHGKTTLMKTLAGLIDPWEGDILMQGQLLNLPGQMKNRPSQHLNYDLFRRRRIDPRQVVRHGLIYVMQGNLLFPEMTVEEVLAIAPAAAGDRSGTDEMKDRIHDLFPRLKERWSSKIRFLSGGERQMASIAAGLLAMPKLLILDEPTLGLSPKMRLELGGAINAIRKTGLPLLIIDQNVEFLTSLIDRLYLFDHGTITRELDHAHMPDHKQMMSLMFEGGH
ncbi:MAG: ATP-binding cassette domain-containing protein [Sneathiella sp.]